MSLSAPPIHAAHTPLSCASQLGRDLELTHTLSTRPAPDLTRPAPAQGVAFVDVLDRHEVYNQLPGPETADSVQACMDTVWGEVGRLQSTG